MSRTTSGRRSARALLGVILVLAGAFVMAASSFTVAGPAAAQIPPTVPCTGCGPGPPGPGSGAYAYTQFTCTPPPRFLIFAGVNVATTQPVRYTATYGPVDAAGNPAGPTTTVVLGILQPGQHVPSATMIWDIPHPPGVPQRVQMTGIGVNTGTVFVNFNKVIECDCPDTPTTSPTTTPTTGPTTTPTVPTSAGTTTTSILLTSVSRPPTTSPTLPETGSGGTGSTVGWGAVLLAIGLALLVLTVRSAPDEAEDEA